MTILSQLLLPLDLIPGTGLPLAIGDPGEKTGSFNHGVVNDILLGIGYKVCRIPNGELGQIDKKKVWGSF